MNKPMLGKLLWEIRRFYSWDDGKGEPQAEELQKEISEFYPGRDSLVESVVSEGIAVREAVQDVTRLVREHGTGSSEVDECLAAYREKQWNENEQFNEQVADVFEHQVQKQLEYFGATEKKAELLETRGARSSVRLGQSSHQISDLAPADAWELVIDESGAEFNPSRTRGKEGRLVGVLVPESTTLPAREGFHGSEEEHEAVDSAMQDLLDSPVGVFGFTRRSIPQTGDDDWLVGVFELIEWVIRLLPPAPNGKAKFDVFVEQRAQHTPGTDWRTAVTLLKKKFAERASELAAKVDLSVQVIAKDGHPCLPYADVVAYTWGSSWPSSNLRLKQSGLLDTCLLDTNLEPLARAWEQSAQDARLAESAWNHIFYERSRGNFIADVVLDRIASRLRESDQLQDHYRAIVQRHLDSKAINLSLLGTQVDWLHQNGPTELGMRARLAAGSARLARLNHLGAVDTGLEKELIRLCERLLDEDPGLVCLAELRRSVAATNAFDFEKAWSILTPWLDRPPALPGLQLWGRVQSSAGQVKAFQGDFEAAIAYFEAALSGFARLSDAAVGEAEASQTRAYLAIASMDSNADDDTAEAILLEYLGAADLPTAITTFANGLGSGDKYRHHILTRYLIQRGTPDERAAYLDEVSDPLSTQFGHPWQLILFYRAWMLRERGQPYENVVEAALVKSLAKVAGPTLEAIGVVIAAISSRWGAEHITETQLQRLRRSCVAKIPAVENHLSALDDASLGDLEILRASLPFNFH